MYGLREYSLDKNESKEEVFYTERVRTLVNHLGVIFIQYQEKSPTPKIYYGLNKNLAVLAITNAVSDLRRSTDYHSKSGPSDFKTAGFCGRWIAHQRPIWIAVGKPHYLHTDKLEEINSHFAVFFTQSLLGLRIYPKLISDLRYCFEYRRPSGDDISMLLEHALKHSPDFHTKLKK